MTLIPRSLRRTRGYRGISGCWSQLTARRIQVPVLKRRWVVRVRNRRGQLVSERRFVRKSAAKAYGQWMETTAIGGHKWQAFVPPGQEPVWIVEIEKDPAG